ncbi:hypothetical protein HY256_02090, partial [Candidatus Sumerlaeota bacterium]|nr:hypothetical protein [Candidatus Sumerlaeota bacterium]
MIKNNQYRLHLLPLRFAIILMPIFYACGGEAEKPKPPKEAADHPGAAPVANTYSGNPKHIILISMDTTRPGHFGCYGNPWIKTPNMDALA